jgi:POT family proton-dependent oligopeptide transporter
MIPGSIVGSDSTDAFIFACVPVLYFYSSLYFNAAKEEKRPILALLAIFAVVILFWAVFKQNGSALNTWADRYTDREITGVTKSTFETFKLAKNISYTKDSIPLYDQQFRLQRQDGKALKEFAFPPYFRNITPDKLPTEGPVFQSGVPI